MPTARESLLDAATVELTRRPWPEVRMVEVALAAGVSRQTLYNEFGSKDGLARALVGRAAESYLRGAERVLAVRLGTADRLTALAEWTVGAARGSPLVRALLTGCWGERLPQPGPREAPGVRPGGVPSPRRARPPTPGPTQLMTSVRDRAVAALGKEFPQEDPEELSRRSETALRLALSYVVAPDGEGADSVECVRSALTSDGGARGDLPVS
ncbi:TetR/AcrR family transcriptional regulator [Streptomyces tsukubensis]|uniref:HTH tetR-type domain-containing protein n=1 Tax=Streptomyces tsukubensis TaxID=83656 RepID=A0A1V4ABJ6_9ACTN|nr:TetR/AcrR family transcriptional regulator [Streptomyces tsukubensis]OON81248.1 hypothetical protein B1H18_07755 [Streptomyces tsukubensis]QFR95639.1 TetR family transcriptional regulator [Streptomyces tsukubensis]